MIRCKHKDYLPDDDYFPRGPQCDAESKWLGCGYVGELLCDKHKCRCKKPIAECECKGDFKHCPMCKGEGWVRIR